METINYILYNFIYAGFHTGTLYYFTLFSPESNLFIAFIPFLKFPPIDKPNIRDATKSNFYVDVRFYKSYYVLLDGYIPNLKFGNLI